MLHPLLTTARLVLRPWRDDDLQAFAAINADARAMEYLPKCLSRAESDAWVARARAHFARHGFGPWAVVLVEPAVPAGAGALIGFVGLFVPNFVAAFTPCVEIGWRLAPARWGQGYASEAARAALRFGFERVGLDEIVAYTVPANLRSQAVMRRLGMQRDPAADFDHPNLPPGHSLRRHVLYRLRRPLPNG